MKKGFRSLPRSLSLVFRFIPFHPTSAPSPHYNCNFPVLNPEPQSLLCISSFHRSPLGRWDSCVCDTVEVSLSTQKGRKLQQVWMNLSNQDVLRSSTQSQLSSIAYIYYSFLWLQQQQQRAVSAAGSCSGFTALSLRFILLDLIPIFVHISIQTRLLTNRCFVLDFQL